MGDYIPGIGKKLAGEGLIGTKGMLKKQVESRLPGAREATNAAAADLPGPFSPYDSAKGISDYIKKTLPDTPMPAGAMPQNAEAANEASKRLWAVVGRPNMNGSEALDASRKIGSQAYREGDPLAGIKATLNRIDAGSIKSSLKNASPGVKSGLEREAALETAKGAMSDPATLAQVAKSLGLAGGRMGVGGIGGFLVDGKEGAAVGALGGALASTSAAKSAAAQALIKGSQASPAISTAIIDNYLRRKKEAQK